MLPIQLKLPDTCIFLFLKEKLTIANTTQTITVPSGDKLGLLGPVLNMQGLLECPYCDYTTDKKANWYKHKKRHSGIFYSIFHCIVCFTRNSSNRRMYKEVSCEITKVMFVALTTSF